jgi:hypothetical protein
MTGIQSASGVLALLTEDDDELKKYALDKLNLIVDDFWPEISQHIGDMYVDLILTATPDFSHTSTHAGVCYLPGHLLHSAPYSICLQENNNITRSEGCSLQ